MLASGALMSRVMIMDEASMLERERLALMESMLAQAGIPIEYKSREQVVAEARLQSLGAVMPRNTYRDKLQGVDISAEYALIQEKKSTLSRAKRAAVVYRMERSRLV